MTREEFRKEIKDIFPKYKELKDFLNINGKEQYSNLNKYFCGESFPWGVEYIRFDNINSIFDFSICYSSHNGKYTTLYETDNKYYIEKGYNTHGLTEKQMCAIVMFIKNKIIEFENSIATLYEKGRKEPQIEDLEKVCEKTANEILKNKTDKYGNKLRAILTNKRLIIQYYGNNFGKVDWYYNAEFHFRKDNFGINYISFFEPLCGECDIKFEMETFKNYVNSFIS